MEIVSNLKPLPNQSFNVNIGDYVYGFRFFSNDGFMHYNFSIDEDPVITGGRIMFGQPLIIYRYQEVDGNFILDIPSGDEPNYEEFGLTQSLLYLTQSESDDLREFIKNGQY